MLCSWATLSELREISFLMVCASDRWEQCRMHWEPCKTWGLQSCPFHGDCVCFRVPGKPRTAEELRRLGVTWPAAAMWRAPRHWSAACRGTPAERVAAVARAQLGLPLEVTLRMCYT